MTPPLNVFIQELLPEWILLIGGCATMIMGIGRGPNAGRVAGPLALFTLLLGLAAAFWIGPPDTALELPGLLISPFTHYVRLGALFLGVLGLLCNLHLPEPEERGEFFSMIVFSLLGLLLTGSANNLIVLFFAIELVSVPTYILIVLSRRDGRAPESAVKYFFLGAMASAMMVYGFSFLYGALGGYVKLESLNDVASLASFAAESSMMGTYATIGLLLAFAGLFFKLAAVPFHSYAADVYEGAASPVTGLLGFLPKFAALVVGAKLLAIFHWDVPASVMWMLWIVAALTMTVGNTLALLQDNAKRVLAYSSVSHSGYMLIGLLVGPAYGAAMGSESPARDGVAAMLFYMVVYGAMNLGAFAVLSGLRRSDGESVEKLHELEGLSVRQPLLALAMAVCMFSLMGFPPTAGLLGKVYIFGSAFSAGDGHPFAHQLKILAVIGVINSAIGAYYYLRIVATCYLKDPSTETQRTGGASLKWGVALCSLTMIVMFVYPALVSTRAKDGAAALADPRPTIKKVAAEGAVDESGLDEVAAASMAR